MIETFESYSDQAALTYKFGKESKQEALQYLALGLNGEAGEVAEWVKKKLHHGKDLSVEDLVLELGDVLWYLDRLASVVGSSLGHVADMNIKKLRDRHAP